MLTTQLTNYIKAGFPGVCIETTEETRALHDILAVIKTLKRGGLVWSATEGMKWCTGTNNKGFKDTENLTEACKIREPGAIYIFRDIHTWPFDRDPVLARAFRDLLVWGPTEGSTVIILAPRFRPHNTFEKMISMIDYGLPGPEDIRKIAEGIAETNKKTLECSDAVLRACGGLTTTEAENALSLSLVETKKYDADVVYREKVASVRKTGLLDIVAPDPRGLDAIGGLGEAKNWIMRRKRAYSPEAEKFGLPAPKGILVIGPPGTGKSLLAKVVGTALEIPTLRLDVGSMFNSLVGESEARIRDALALAEAIAPCALWLDEIDKGLAGASGSGAGDSGVTKRVFGTVISWMQDRKRPVFLIATANQLDGLPPELLRKGRFDEIFFVDLPRDDERDAILKIHLGRVKRELGDLKAVVAVTKGFTGSELENVVHEGLFSAFEDNRELEVADLVAAANDTVPLSETAKEQITRIREWAESRARFASTQPSKRLGLNESVSVRRVTQ